MGLYRLEILQDGEVTSAQRFAVNLFATGESDIRPLPEAELQLGGGLAAADADEQLGTQEFWMWLALPRCCCSLSSGMSSPAVASADAAATDAPPLQISMGTASKFLSLITDSNDIPASV